MPSFITFRRKILTFALAIAASVLVSSIVFTLRTKSISGTCAATTRTLDEESEFHSADTSGKRKSGSQRGFSPVSRYQLPDSIVNWPLTMSTRRNKSASHRDVFIRAVFIHLPSDDDDGDFAAELKWLYRSWREMLQSQSEHWRTDLVVVTRKVTPVLKILNCTGVSRTAAKDPNACRYADGYNPELAEFADQKTVYSVHSVTWEGVDLDQYDYVLRTDIDTFLTPAFADWNPGHMVVGGGGYIAGYDLLTSHRLNRIADYLRLKNSGMENIGSTWYGPVTLVKRAAMLSVECMRYLKKHEFTQLERSPEFGINGWPEWHYGVLTMYGGHLAINHLSVDNQITIENNKLDFFSTSSNPVKDHPHLHAWHTEATFSKFVFFNDGYKNITLESLDRNTCKDYCLYMALDSKTRYF